MKSSQTFLAACSLVLALAACGVKRPPIPPEKLFPLAAKNLHVSVLGGCAELAWKYPGLAQPEQYRIARTEQPASGAGPQAEQNFEVPGAETSFRDCGLKSGFLYGYAVTGRSQAQLEGEPSETVWVNVTQLPPAPENLSATAGDKFADLAWDLSEDLAYNLYRSKEQDNFAGRPLNLAPMLETKYSDGNLENSRPYFYCLRAVVVQKDYPPLESDCALVSVAPIDLIAPAAPRGLVAAVSDHAVLLRWFKSPEPDLLGYLVYRRRPQSAAWQQLTPEPIPEPEYLDPQAFKLKGRFEYAVSALDNASSKNESRRSQVELVSIP